MNRHFHYCYKHHSHKSSHRHQQIILNAVDCALVVKTFIKTNLTVLGHITNFVHRRELSGPNSFEVCCIGICGNKAVYPNTVCLKWVNAEKPTCHVVAGRIQLVLSAKLGGRSKSTAYCLILPMLEFCISTKWQVVLRGIFVFQKQGREYQK